VTFWREDRSGVVRSRGFTVGAVIMFAGVAAIGYQIPNKATSGVQGPKQQSPAAARPVRVLDGFFRSNDPTSLGVTDNGSPWKSVSGVWGVQNHRAYVTKPSPGLSIAVVDTGSSDETAGVTMSVVERGSALILNYSDLQDYIELVASPRYATWNLDVVSRGELRSLGNTGLADTKNGASIAVHLHGSTADVFIDDRQLRSFTVTIRPGATAAGIGISGPDASSARWTDFSVAPDRAASG
jgi:hypothetical protein